jgi:hypothetical protein
MGMHCAHLEKRGIPGVVEHLLPPQGQPDHPRYAENRDDIPANRVVEMGVQIEL